MPSMACSSMPLWNFPPGWQRKDLVPPQAAVPFRKCKWCLRNSHEENPIVALRPTKPMIPWRRALGQECGICPYVLDLNPQYHGRQRAVVLQEMNEDPQQREAFHEARKEWERQKNLNPTGKNPTQSALAGSGAETVVRAKQTSKLQTSKFMGNLWPSSLYLANKGKKVAKKDLTWVEHNGQKIYGILLGPGP